MFDVDKAVQWCYENGHTRALKNIEILDEWRNQNCVVCLDEFELYKCSPDMDEDQIDHIVSKNVDFKFDLESHMRTGSCYGLGCLLYEILVRLSDK